MALGFSNLDQAFILGSNQIKDTQEEIANLKKLILETGTKKKVPETSSATKVPETSSATNVPLNYTRMGPTADPVVANFSNPKFSSQSDTNDLMLLKVISHPKFDDIVKGYVLMNHPEWMNGNLTQTTYSKSYFGNKYANSVCSDIKRYIIFFIICVLIFVVLTLAGSGKP